MEVGADLGGALGRGVSLGFGVRGMGMRGKGKRGRGKGKAGYH